MNKNTEVMRRIPRVDSANRADLTEIIQSSVREKMSRTGLVKKNIGRGTLVILGTFSIAPLLSIVATGGTAVAVTEGVKGFVIGIAGNAVASWIDNVAQGWAGISNPTDERLEELAIRLEAGLVKDEKLRFGLINLLEKTDAPIIAVEELKKSNDQGFKLIINEINNLRNEIVEKASRQSPEAIDKEIQEKSRSRRSSRRQPSEITSRPGHSSNASLGKQSTSQRQGTGL